MCAKKFQPLPRGSPGDKPNPDSPPLDHLPKQFPEQVPLSDDGLEASKKEAASTMKAGPGEASPEAELPEDGPERPRETPEEQNDR